MKKIALAPLAIVALITACATSTSGRDASGGSTARAAETKDVSAQPYDLRFLDTMTMHHEDGVEMAKLAQAKASHSELQSFAARVVADQTRDIQDMKAHRQQHFAGSPEAMDHSLPGMSSMPPMDMSSLQAKSGAEFDRAFIDMMIPHHQAAILMAQDAVKQSSMPQVKQMAQKMADQQTKEIEQLQSWRKAWFGGAQQ